MDASSKQEHPIALSQEIAIPLSMLGSETEWRLLGEGGFGKVFSGSWKHTALHHTKVAIKQLKDTHFSVRVLSEFQAEVSVHAKLVSPHIVKLYGVTLEQPYCMVMEYMPNQSLDKYLQHHDPSEVSWTIRVQWAQDIALGLDYLHSQHPPIIHADLKSLNVLLDQSHCAKLADFGLATIKKETASRTLTSTKAGEAKGPQGSLLWMAPELFRRGAKSSKESDVYAYGMVIWEISSHQYPFAEDAQKGTELIREYIKDGDLEPFPAGTPEPYQALGDACRTKEPNIRPSTAKLLQVLGVLKRNQTASNASPAAVASSKHSPATQANTPYMLQQTGPVVTASPAVKSPYLNNQDSRPVTGHAVPSRPVAALLSSAYTNPPGHAASSVTTTQRPTAPPWSTTSNQSSQDSEEVVRLKAELEAMKLAQKKPTVSLTAGQRVDQQAQEVKGRVSERAVELLLTQVMRGNVEGVEKLLGSNNALVFAQGDVKDLSERSFRRITAFQYAVWALDKEMWELILRYLPKEAASDQLCALEKERVDIVKEHGVHFSFEELLRKQQHYIENAPKWYYKKRAEEYWCKEVGGAQRKMPSWFILTMCEEGDQVLWVKQDVKMKVKREMKHLGWWFDDEYYGGKLGFKWAAWRAAIAVRGECSASYACANRIVVRGGVFCIQPWDWMVESTRTASAILSSARTQELADLKSEVYSATSTPSMGLK